MWCVHDMPSQAALVHPPSSKSITAFGEQDKAQTRRRPTLLRRKQVISTDTSATSASRSNSRKERRSAVTSMKSFVRSTRSGRSRRGHGDKDEMDVSEDEIFDARGMFECELRRCERR